jgi:hypothetical protein
MLDFPKKTVTLTILSDSGVEVNYDVKFPNNKQIMDIQSDLSVILKGQAGNIVDSYTNDGLYAYNLALAICTFKNLVPELAKDLNFEKMDALEGAKLVAVYVKQFAPWYNEWREILQNGGVPISKTEK